MSKLTERLSRLPIKWKLTFWSSLLLCVLFVVYNFAQYLVITQWLLKQEEIRVQSSMNEIILFYKEKGDALNTESIRADKGFVEKLNQSDQFIRILNQAGEPIVSVTNDIPLNWVAPQTVSVPQTIGAWHFQDHLLIVRSPLAAGHFNGTVEIVVDLVTLDRMSGLVLFMFAAGGVVAVVLSGIGGLWIARQLLKPIQSVTETMRKVKDTGLEARVDLPASRDEIAELALIFNQMMDQLEASFRKQRQFVEDASHELRTPVSIIEGHLALLQRWGKHDPAILEESLGVSLHEMGRLKSLVYELLDMTRAESGADVTPIPLIDPVPTVSETVEEYAALHPDFRFDAALQKIEGRRIAIQPNHLAQILHILLDNAVKYAAERKEIDIRGEHKGGRLLLRVTDFGEGIPEADIPLVFDRFYRVDKSRSRSQGGSGLGLAIAKRLVENYGGVIGVECGETQGTRFTVEFPIAVE